MNKRKRLLMRDSVLNYFSECGFAQRAADFNVPEKHAQALKQQAEALHPVYQVRKKDGAIWLDCSQRVHAEQSHDPDAFETRKLYTSFAMMTVSRKLEEERKRTAYLIESLQQMHKATGGHPACAEMANALKITLNHVGIAT